MPELVVENNWQKCKEIVTGVVCFVCNVTWRKN